MPDRTAGRSWLLPSATVLVCVAGAVLLTRDLGATDSSTAPPAAAAGAAAVPALDAGAGDLRDLLPTPEQWGYGWIADESAPSQAIADGPGLLHPCGATYASDAQRVELSRSNVVQDGREVPDGMAMTFEVARYSGSGAPRALQERAGALQQCSTYRTTFAGHPDTSVAVALLAAPQGGNSTAAHLAASPSTSIGMQAVEYTYLVAQQGDVLLSAVVGNGNAGGSDLDTFAAGYFHQARLKLAGLPHPSPQEAAPGPVGS